MQKGTALAALFAFNTATHAGELTPYSAESIELGSIRGITYYTEVQGGSRVVTTLADGEAGLPVRFEVTLADGQTLTISVPGKIGEPGQVLRISHIAPKVVISNSQPAADRLAATGAQSRGE